VSAPNRNAQRDESWDPIITPYLLRILSSRSDFAIKLRTGEVFRFQIAELCGHLRDPWLILRGVRREQCFGVPEEYAWGNDVQIRYADVVWITFQPEECSARSAPSSKA